MKRTFVFLAALLLLCTNVSWVSAAPGDDIAPLWVYVNYVNGSINISSNGMAIVSGTAKMRAGEVTKTTITASLQQNKSGTWQEIKSWTASTAGISAKLPEKSCPVAHGYYYRLVVTGKAYNGATLLEQGSSIQNFGYFE